MTQIEEFEARKKEATVAWRRVARWVSSRGLFLGREVFDSTLRIIGPSYEEVWTLQNCRGLDPNQTFTFEGP